MSDLLNVDNLTVRFEVKRGGGWGKKSYLYAVDDISFAVKKGRDPRHCRGKRLGQDDGCAGGGALG